MARQLRDSHRGAPTDMAELPLRGATRGACRQRNGRLLRRSAGHLHANLDPFTVTVHGQIDFLRQNDHRDKNSEQE